MLKHKLHFGNLIKGVQYPRQAVDETLYEVLYRIPATLANLKTTIGTNVYSLDWDVLILLDTCRVDALEVVAPEYKFLSKIGSIQSVGGASPEWIAKTFVDKYEADIQNTAYLSANVFTQRLLEERHHETVSALMLNSPTNYLHTYLQ